MLKAMIKGDAPALFTKAMMAALAMSLAVFAFTRSRWWL